jgi:hypothetical protein
MVVAQDAELLRERAVPSDGPRDSLPSGAGQAARPLRAGGAGIPASMQT